MVTKDMSVIIGGGEYKELWELANNHKHMMLLQKEQYESQMEELRREIETQKARALKAEQTKELAICEYGEIFRRCMQAEEKVKQVADLPRKDGEK